MKGYTLIEMMVVVVITILIATMGVFILTKAGDYYRLRNATLTLKQTVEFVRQYALEKNRTYIIDFDKLDGSSETPCVFYFTNTGDTVAVSKVTLILPNNVTLGTESVVTSAVGGGATVLPQDGIDFPNNKLISYPHQGITSGVIYFKNPAEQRALQVNSLGQSTIYLWEKSEWNEQG